jgi:hypothetical protein
MINMGKKEIFVGTGKVLATTGAAAATGDPKLIIAAAIGEVLSVGLDAFAEVSRKRTNELFDSEEFAYKVVDEVKRSDDFASFVFSLWRRYNDESSEARRKLLKSILNKATYEAVRDYENFSKIFLVAQQITSGELIILKELYSSYAYEFANTGISEDFQLNVHEMQRLVTDRGVTFSFDEQLSEILTQLGNYGLLSESPAAIGGPFYRQRRFGRVFMSYIQEE